MAFGNLKDRGIIKWQAAAFLPEQGGLMAEVWRDGEREPKPELDEYQLSEIDERIHFAMEYAVPVEAKVWRDGFVTAVTGRIARLDEVGRRLYIEQKGVELARLAMDEVVGMRVYG